MSYMSKKQLRTWGNKRSAFEKWRGTSLIGQRIYTKTKYRAMRKTARELASVTA